MAAQIVVLTCGLIDSQKTRKSLCLMEERFVVLKIWLVYAILHLGIIKPTNLLNSAFRFKFEINCNCEGNI